MLIKETTNKHISQVCLMTLCPKCDLKVHDKGDATREGCTVIRLAIICVCGVNVSVLDVRVQAEGDRETEGLPKHKRGTKRRQRNRDAARKSRKKQTQRADELHEVRTL